MNKGIYRLVWNRCLGAPQVVSEVAKSNACGGPGEISGPGACPSRVGSKAWPLALLSLAIGSSAFAVPYDVTSGANAGAGSLREAMLGGGSLHIDSAVSTIALTSGITLYAGPVELIANGPLTITGPGLVGSGHALELQGDGNGFLTTTITGQFNGQVGSGGITSAGAPGLGGNAAGGAGTHGMVSAGSAAITGSYFDLSSNATLTGGHGGISPVLGVGGTGGNGTSGMQGQAGGAGGAGTSGQAASSGGAGVSGYASRMTNSGLISGGNGANGAAGGIGGAGGAGGSSSGGGKYGGNGGAGGQGGNGSNGGTGGNGIEGGTLEIINRGTIQGGNGGTAGGGGAGGAGGIAGAGTLPPAGVSGMDGANGANGLAGTAGSGGIGILLSGDSSIVNSGTIAGGLGNGGAGPRANAIELHYGGNTLTLESGSVINGNVVSFSGSSDKLVLGGDSNVSANTFDLGALGAQGSSKQYQGFGRFEKEGSSTWTLTGYDSTGKNWDVTAGTLILSNNAELSGSVNINTPGTLRAGNSYIAGNLFNEGKLVLDTPASAAAALDIGGTFTQSSQGTLQISVLSDSQYSKLYMDGDAYLDGTLNIDVKQGNTLALGNILTDIIRTDGTITGQFSAVTDNSFLFNFTPTYHIDSIDLDVVADSSGGGNSVSGSVQALGNSPARGAAQVLDGVIANNPTGRLASYFIPLTTQEEVANAASETLPLMTGASTEAARTALSGINGVIQARSESVRGVSSGDVAFTDQHLWIKPFGSWADQESSGNLPGFNTRVGGLAFGLDASLNERLLLGAAFVYANAETRNSGAVSRQQLSTNVYQLVGYGTYQLDHDIDLSFQIDAGQNHNEGKRNIDFAGLKAKSNYDSWTAHAGVSLDRTFSLSTATRFTPSVRADYTWIKDEAYNEKGADVLNLQAKSRTTDQFILGVDGKLSHDLTDRVNLSGNLGVGYDFLADRNSITTSFAGAPGAAFTTYGGDAQRWLVRGGTGLTYKVSDQVQLGVRYDLEKRSDYLNQTASAEARWAF